MTDIRIDLVLPPGRHSWNLGEGWSRTLQRLGWLGSVFHAHDRNCNQIFDHIRHSKSDLIILMGGDHHLSFLHDTEAKRDVWRGIRMPSLSICYETILDTMFPGSIEKSRSAAQTFSHFAVCDEKDEAFFAEIGAPVTWMPQCADPETFFPDSTPRRPLIFFRGKYDLALHYQVRSNLLKRLQMEPTFHFMDKEVDDETLTTSYRTFLGTVNLPGVFMGYNVRTFEALASGCILLQHHIPERPKNHALFSDRHLLLYSSDHPDDLVRLTRDIVSAPGDYAALAADGREAFLSGHTIEHRIRQLVGFVDDSWKHSRKIQIGCGDVVLPGFINVDARAVDPRVVVQDAATLPDIPNAEGDVAYACHILEHFPRTRTVEVLRNWRKKLKPGGRLYVSVPDTKFLALLYLLKGKLNYILPPLFGGQEYQGNVHFTAFDAKTLRQYMFEAGFCNIRSFDPQRMPFTRFDCSRWALSLNLSAENPPIPGARNSRRPIGDRAFSAYVALKRYWKGFLDCKKCR